uniref:ribonuclease n=1 Tax=uncultured Sphingomonas sp. TaxID=158754 RepID=UPI0025DEC014|nr:ribonuclease [uncultured Sphingomonas sp.]
MPDWLLERGIGETRAVLVDGNRIVEARVLLDGTVPAGSVVEGRLRSVGTGGRNALAVTNDGVEVLLPQRPGGVSEGAAIRVEITREAIPGPEPWKRSLGRMTEALPSLFAILGKPLPFPPGRDDPLARAGWSDLLEEARTGTVRFSGGELKLHLTPAMTLIDVDGTLPPPELAVAGAAAAGAAIRRLGIGGSIGIDLPTAPGKEPRQRAAAALDAALGATQFERTAVNGFGFLQVVRPRRHPSLLELASDRAAFEARTLLRRTAIDGHGPCRLAVHPAVAAVLEAEPDWLLTIARQRGGAVTLRSDAALAISGGHAEPV